MRKHMRAFWQDESGATAIEYSLLVGLMGLGIIVAMTDLTSQLEDLFADIQEGVKAAAGIE
ncbi:Flp family type IVb pilin [uncultured Cohaesibacter sp.]|uniref:Flp family type IVb pilin n=1 Tax=uncultured Cohaesibacter sp. TaxID=1002546 RepID=UPI0029C8CF9E|nr:Flp family type IVb pilin [uncultured Cohaesibacter sp.]